MKMTMQPVNLDGITDDRKFQDLSLLVDRNDFFKNLDEFKKKGIPDEPLAKFFGEALWIGQELLWLYQYPRSFTQAIVKIVEGKAITDEDVENLYSPIIKAFPEFLPKEKHIFLLNPRIPWGWHKEDFLEELKKRAREIWKDSVKHSILSLPPIPNIRRNRKWYWLHKNGRSYREIQQLPEKENGSITRDGVIKAIKRGYESYLNVDIQPSPNSSADS